MSDVGNEFDLIVIGGGSGGLAGAFRAAGHGARVALLEPGPLGGTCVNLGCVPKKAMWLAADVAHKIGQARQLGFDLPASAPLDWRELILHRARYIENIHAAYRARLAREGVALLPYRGELTGMPGEVRCGDLRWRARHLLVATGGHPLKPEIPGAELGGVSDDFFALTEAPARVALIGGGYIAVELAGVLQALGSQVEVFVRQSSLLTSFDAEVAARLAEDMAQAGVRWHFDTEVSALRREADGRTALVVGEGAHGGFDRVLFATGRGPNSRGIGLEAASVRCNARGQIEIDAFQNTCVPGVYATGDVTAQPALTPYAIAASRRLMDRLFGSQPEARACFDEVPTVVFSHPPIAKLGLSEAEARERHGGDLRILRADFRPMLSALADCPTQSLFKLICAGPEDRVVGLHLIGEGCDEILQGFAVAMRMGMKLSDLRDTLAIHPTSAEEVVLI
ncbi:glutathione-disulfide reductase [Lysobacter pythonis]|uniref:Glutathione-disulfide reductase n=1 Tax=Solilutibacter pythonis TaxID=2483112 RepID=A0A3M2HKH9_9GAMM|nr:glutathione-disulfide reductase [Lysobacter pythonis]RMH88383.1 glutathione-disulfide reductase [Lysobacter pythonis]